MFFFNVGGRKGLLPTPDEFPHFEGRMDANREPGENFKFVLDLSTVEY